MTLLWKKVILQWEQVLGERDLDGRRIFNDAVLQAGGRDFTGKQKTDGWLLRRVEQHLLSNQSDEGSSRPDILASSDRLTFCPKRSKILSTPKNHYFNDACRFINCWVTQKKATRFPLMKGVLLSAKTNDTGGTKFCIEGNDEIVIGDKELGAGFFGRVFQGSILTPLGSEKAVVKINSNTIDEGKKDVIEAIIQLICYCYLRSPTSLGEFLSFNRHAKIPKILSVRSIKKQTVRFDDGLFAHYGVPYHDGRVNMLAMQPLEGTVHDLLDGNLQKHRRGVPGQQEIIKTYINEILLQIAVTLFTLKLGLAFEHRDLKGDNIMYTTRQDGMKQFFMIDFGISQLTYKKVKVDGYDDDDDDEGFKRSDLAGLMISLFKFVCIDNQWDEKCMKLMPPWCHLQMKSILRNLKRRFDIDGLNPWMHVPDSMSQKASQNSLSLTLLNDELKDIHTLFTPQKVIESILNERKQFHALQLFEELIQKENTPEEERMAINDMGFATKDGSWSVIEPLLSQYGTKLASTYLNPQHFKMTALHNVAWLAPDKLESADSIKRLAAIVNIEARTRDGLTPLHLASISGKVHQVRALLQCGADAAADVMGDTTMSFEKLMENDGKVNKAEIMALLRDSNLKREGEEFKKKKKKKEIERSRVEKRKARQRRAQVNKSIKEMKEIDHAFLALLEKK